MKKQEIKFDKRNYRKHNDENKRVIKKSLKELGAGRSIVIDNEGENTYTTLGSRGMLFFTHNVVMLHQKPTQSNECGMSGAYIDGGTYIKSFYSVITMPSAVKISMIGNKNMRIHHKVFWRNCVPMILRETIKKK